MTKDLERFGFSDFTHPAGDAANPVYPSLMSQMKAELVVNPESDVWLIYDRPLPEVMKWIEYDVDLETLTLVSISGKIQDFGMRVPPAMKKYLRRAKQIYVVHQGEDRIKDMSLVPLLVRDSIN